MQHLKPYVMPSTGWLFAPVYVKPINIVDAHRAAARRSHGLTFRRSHHRILQERCAGFHIHADHEKYDHGQFKPFRLVILFLKALRSIRPDYEIWRDFPYEYESGRLPIDVINGSPLLRDWVDDPDAAVSDMEAVLTVDEQAWMEQSAKYHAY